MKKTILIGLFCISAYSSVCQDSIRKQYIVFTISSLADLHLSTSYCYVLNDKIDLIINPRFKYSYHQPENFNYWFDYSNYKTWPWAYHRTILRTGILYKMKSFFVEPLLEYDYGFRNNQWTITDISPDRIKLLIDRHYHSMGILTLIGLDMSDEKQLLRLFWGLGGHVRFFSFNYRDQASDIYDPGIPASSTLTEKAISFHAGVDLGWYF